MSCWQLLGLTPGAQPREIKRRFAQLVKVTRPEDDPEGYQQLRDAYEAALEWSERGPEEDASLILEKGDEEVFAHDYSVPTSSLSLSSPPLGGINPTLSWQDILEHLFKKNEQFPHNAQRQLDSALSQLAILDLKARILFEEALLMNLHQIFRPLLMLAAAKTFRWHLVTGGPQAAIQAAINESCLLYYKIEKAITPYFFADMSAIEEVECGEKLAEIYFSLKDNDKSRQWFDFIILLQIENVALSDSFLCQLIERVGWFCKPDEKSRQWSLTHRFHALEVMHRSSYQTLLAAINVEDNIYTASMVINSYLKAAEQGHVASYIKLAGKYYNGVDVEKDDAQAVFWFTRAAESGDISAQHNLGILYRDGIGVEANAQKAFVWFMKAAQQGDEKAQYDLGSMYASGQGVEQDDQQSFNWYLKSAEQGYSWSQLKVARIFRKGLGVDIDLAASFAWCARSADSGYDEAQCELGIIYFHGWGVAQDCQQAREWYLKAAEQGEYTAQYNLSILYRDGLGVEQDQQKSFEWCYQSAMQGFVKAQNEFGHKYYDGQGIPQNKTLAYEWFSKAAEQNDSCAQFYLGDMHRLGEIANSDAQQAFYWLSLAVEQNYSHAQFALGMLYLDGAGVEQNSRMAFHYFHAAALQGIAAAQNRVALMYEDGKGVEKDLLQTRKWYTQAAEQGDYSAQYNLALLYKNHELDFQKAVHWFSLAYEQGDIDAAFMLHKIYLQGGNGIEKDEQQGFTWCVRAAIRGHKQAQDALSLLYYYGRGTEQSNVDAWAWALIFGPAGMKLRIKRAMSDEEIGEAQTLAKELIIECGLESSFHSLS